MSLTSGANKWASKAVIILQLAAWTAVGIVLLQRGVMSLRYESSRNATQIIHSSETILGNSSTYRRAIEPEKDPTVVPFREKQHVDRRTAKLANGGSTEATQSAEPEERLSDPSKHAETHNSSPSKTIDNAKTRNDIESEKDHVQRTSNDISADFSKEINYTETWRKESPESSERNEKKIRLSHLSKGGAAAAIAMVAVGAVMLILGPAVVVLRALDERRQERRFLKLSTRDDLPPTYEQATLMEEAPRYSTLSLNTILAHTPRSADEQRCTLQEN